MIISMPFPVRFWVRKMKAAVFATLMLLGMPMQVLGDVADDSSLALKPKKGRALRGAVEVDAHAPSNYTRAGAHSSNYPAAMDGTFLEVSGEAVKPKADRGLTGAMDFLAASDYPNAHAYELNQTAMYGDFLELSKEAVGISQRSETEIALAVALKAFKNWWNGGAGDDAQKSQSSGWSEKAATALASVNKMRRYMDMENENSDVCAEGRLFVYHEVAENFFFKEIQRELDMIEKGNGETEKSAAHGDSCPSPVGTEPDATRLLTGESDHILLRRPQQWFVKYHDLAFGAGKLHQLMASPSQKKPLAVHVDLRRLARGQEIAKELRAMAKADLETDMFKGISDTSTCKAHAFLTEWAALGDWLHMEPQCGMYDDSERGSLSLPGIEDKPDGPAFTEQVRQLELPTKPLDEEKENLATKLLNLDVNISRNKPHPNSLTTADLSITDQDLLLLRGNLMSLRGAARDAAKVHAAAKAAEYLQTLLTDFDKSKADPGSGPTHDTWDECASLFQEVRKFPQGQASESNEEVDARMGLNFYARYILGRSRLPEYHQLAAEAEAEMRISAALGLEECEGQLKFVVELVMMAKTDVQSESFKNADARVTLAEQEGAPEAALLLTGSTFNSNLKPNRKWLDTLKRWAELLDKPLLKNDQAVALVKVLVQQEVLRKNLVEAELPKLAASLPSSKKGAEVDQLGKKLTELIDELKKMVEAGLLIGVEE